LLASVRSGFGLAVLPCFVADNDPDLLRCLPHVQNDVSGLWLLTHERFKGTTRVRAVMDLLGTRLLQLGKSAPVLAAQEGMEKIAALPA
jgi:DNA-binding transcriptional LysR family regulator